MAAASRAVVPNAGPAPAALPADAVARIVDATIDQLVAEGIGAFNLQDVARRAGVSKGLIHYHFASREALLARAVDVIEMGMTARLAGTLQDAAPAGAIDRLWDALEHELTLGHLRVLGELAHDPVPDVRSAVERALRRRRDGLASQVERLFAVLALTPRVPTSLIAEVVLAFEQGLASRGDSTGDADREAERRATFDVMWLALLSLTE